MTARPSSGRRRPPADLLAYFLLLALILGFAASRGERFDAPPAPPPLTREEGRVLKPASRFAPERTVKISGDLSGPRSGTAFSVNPAGVWVTARHVVAGCGRIALLEGSGRGAEGRLSGGADPAASDVAVVLTRGGAPALGLSARPGLRIGQRGFHPGFPGGAPGEATSRLLGRQALVIGPKGRAARSGARREEVLSWAEAGRSGGPGARIAGLSGAPVLDGRGEVVGVTLAAAPRRGRIYAASLEEIRAALAAAGATAQGGAAEPVTAKTYARRSEALRDALSVAEIVCLQ